MNDNPLETQGDEQAAPDKTAGSTTFDVGNEAAEALRRFQEEQARKSGQAAEIPVIEGDATLRIEIGGASTPLLLNITQETVIGRRDPTTQTAPELDLTPYGGYQMGISRRHAVIRLYQKRLEVIDLGSRNGTYLNGHRLKPHQPEPLLDGSEIRLGKITMHLFFHGM